MSRIQSHMRFLSLGIPIEAFTRDIWLLCLSNIAGAFGEGLYFWVFPLYIRQLQADYVQLGLVFSALYAVSALALIPGGILADRFDRKRILILAWTPWVISPLIYSIAQDWIQLIPGAVCWGVSVIGVPAMNAYVITAVRDKTNLASVFSVVWSSYSFSYIFAPAVGAYLATFIGMRWVLRLSGFFCAVATAIFLFIRSQKPKLEKKANSREPRHLEAVRRLWRQVLVWSSFLALVSFFFAIGRTFLPTFLAEEIRMGELHVGIFGSVNFAGATFVGIGMGRLGDRWRKSKAIGLCLLIYASSMVPLLLVGNSPLLMFIAFFYGGSQVVGSLVGSFVGSVAPEHKRGLWASVPLTMNFLAAFMAPYVGGYLYGQSPIWAFSLSILPIPFLMLFALAVLKD